MERRARPWRNAAMIRRFLAVVGLSTLSYWVGGSRALSQSGGEEAWTKFRGQVLFSDMLFAPAVDFPSTEARVASLRRTERTVIGGTDGFWRFHCIAFLDPSPSNGALNVRATDLTDPKERHEIRVFEATAAPEAKELSLDDFVLTSAMGFERGHHYEIAVERRGDEVGSAPTGKRDVYAKGVVTLR